MKYDDNMRQNYIILFTEEKDQAIIHTVAHIVFEWSKRTSLYNNMYGSLHN